MENGEYKEEAIEETNPIRGSYLGIPKTVNLARTRTGYRVKKVEGMIFRQ